MLRFLAEKMGIRVGEDKHTVVAVDGAQFAAHVTRLTCMTRRIDIARTYALPRLESRGDRNVTARWYALRNQLRRLVSAERRNRKSWSRCAAFELGRRD